VQQQTQQVRYSADLGARCNEETRDVTDENLYKREPSARALYSNPRAADTQ